MIARPVTAGLLLALCSATAAAQEPIAPPGWSWTLERPARLVAEQAVPDSAWRFVRMPPGFHVTTGPAGILYPENVSAAGEFSLVADFVVFPGTSANGFGIFLGGSGIDGASPSYLAALLRRDGAIAIVRRDRGQSRFLAPWSIHDVIRPHTGSGVVTNRLRVHASADSLRIFVNDSALVRVPLDAAPTAGRFGFTVGDSVNLHLTILDYVRHLAPPRSR